MKLNSIKWNSEIKILNFAKTIKRMILERKTKKSVVPKILAKHFAKDADADAETPDTDQDQPPQNTDQGAQNTETNEQTTTSANQETQNLEV